MRRRVIRLVKPFVLWVRHLPDRILHPLRRRRAQELVQSSGLPASLLFICFGNICRSPYAAELFRRLLPESLVDEIEIGSAGFHGHDRRSPDLAIEVALRRGTDLSAHRSTLLTPALAGAAGMIIVMSSEQRRTIMTRYGPCRAPIVVLGDLDPSPIETRTIVDPYGRSVMTFDSSYARIDRCLAELVRALMTLARPAEAMAGDLAVGSPLHSRLRL